MELSSRLHAPAALPLERITESSEYEAGWAYLFVYSLCKQLSLTQAEYFLIIVWLENSKG
jgi:hypothetical protein